MIYDSNSSFLLLEYVLKAYVRMLGIPMELWPVILFSVSARATPHVLDKPGTKCM